MSGQGLEEQESRLKSINMKKTIQVIEDPQTGDLLLDLTEEVCNELGWTVGDTLVWEVQDNGSWALRKKDDNLEQEKEDNG